MLGALDGAAVIVLFAGESRAGLQSAQRLLSGAARVREGLHGVEAHAVLSIPVCGLLLGCVNTTATLADDVHVLLNLHDFGFLQEIVDHLRAGYHHCRRVLSKSSLIAFVSCRCRPFLLHTSLQKN